MFPSSLLLGFTVPLSCTKTLHYFTELAEFLRAIDKQHEPPEAGEDAERNLLNAPSSSDLRGTLTTSHLDSGCVQQQACMRHDVPAFVYCVSCLHVYIRFLLEIYKRVCLFFSLTSSCEIKMEKKICKEDVIMDSFFVFSDTDGNIFQLIT
ncbi:hypothetical protein INR49_009774 [Caranx melampygus]|nr:hypothetical protein INR49_009774 [Caranx melampygus]